MYISKYVPKRQNMSVCCLRPYMLEISSWRFIKSYQPTLQEIAENCYILKGYWNCKYLIGIWIVMFYLTLFVLSVMQMAEFAGL